MKHYTNTFSVKDSVRDMYAVRRGLFFCRPYQKHKTSAYAGLCKILGLPTAIPTLSKNQPEGVTFRLAGDVLYADGAEDGCPVTVYSLSGAVLQKTTVQQGCISLHGFQKGVYAIQLGTQGSTLVRK